ncbi:MAG: hypothetical protein MIO90_03980 [Methanomassiliicoccales archaeon]|nr:hypothetical protein [Methanomassiliicoccales archaeon]
MNQERIEKMLNQAKGLPEIFEVVKEAVRVSTGMSRAGLMLGLADLGGDAFHMVGGLYPSATNIILMNRAPMAQLIKEEEKYRSYCFHILLHEYLHSLGMIDEGEVRKRTYQISKMVLGEGHMATHMAVDLSRFLPQVIYGVPKETDEKMEIELVPGFDRSSFCYYA